MEKGFLKASGIIAIIVGVLWCISIIGIIVGIPLIVGGSTMTGYAKLSDEEILEKKSSILGWSIFFVFFTLIAGVLGLVFYFTIERDSSNNPTSYLDEIKKLEELRQKGLITDEEFEAKKKKLLDI